MALPITIVSNAHFPGRLPPFKSSAENFYAVVPDETVATNFTIYKASDPSSSWSEPSSARTGPFAVISAAQSGNNIHIIGYDSTNDIYEYYNYDMTTDSYTTSGETIEDVSGGPPVQPWCSIAVRSDGDVVVVYAGSHDAVMGGDKERAEVNVRSGGSWSGPTSLGDTGGTDPFDTTDVHYGNPICTKASDSDDIHIIYSFQENTADPPTSWSYTVARTIDASNTLSSQINNTEDTGGVLLGHSNAVAYDDAGTQRIAWFGCDGFALEAGRATEDGSGDISSISIAGTGDDARPNGEVGVHSLAVLGTELHGLFSQDLASEYDIYYIKSTDDGVNWDTAVEELDAVTCNYISANIYQRGSQLVLAYVYDDGGSTKYNEKNLTTPSMTKLSDGKLTDLVNTYVGPFES